MIMGGGKTTVITPILALFLADGSFLGRRICCCEIHTDGSVGHTVVTDRHMDAFDVFGDDQAPSVQPQLPATGTGVRPLILAFVNEHHAQTRHDLLSIKEEALAEKLNRARAHLEAEPPELAIVEALAAAVEDHCWSKLTGSGCTHVCFREAFVISKLLRAAASAMADAPSTRGALRHLDVAFILGGPSTVVRDCIQLCSPVPGEHRSKTDTAAGAHEQKLHRTPDPPPSPVLSFPIERCCDAGDLEPFRARYRDNKPFVLQGAMRAWRAMERWNDLEWLRAEFGDRIVPVELGTLGKNAHGADAGMRDQIGLDETLGKYSNDCQAGNLDLIVPIEIGKLGKYAHGRFDSSERGTSVACLEGGGPSGQGSADGCSQPDRSQQGCSQPGCSQPGGGWSERLLPVREMIDLYLVNGATGGVCYLAQHPLFDQLHALCNDFSVPKICSFGKLQHINAWLGSGGTVTPLHFDSYDNVLAQVRSPPIASSRVCRLPSLSSLHFSPCTHINVWLGSGGTVTPLHFDSYDNILALVRSLVCILPPPFPSLSSPHSSLPPCTHTNAWLKSGVPSPLYYLILTTLFWRRCRAHP
jgi:hypothetical protein